LKKKKKKKIASPALGILGFSTRRHSL